MPVLTAQEAERGDRRAPLSYDPVAAREILSGEAFPPEYHDDMLLPPSPMENPVLSLPNWAEPKMTALNCSWWRGSWTGWVSFWERSSECVSFRCFRSAWAKSAPSPSSMRLSASTSAKPSFT